MAADENVEFRNGLAIRVPAVCTEKSDPRVVMVKSAKMACELMRPDR